MLLRKIVLEPENSFVYQGLEVQTTCTWLTCIDCQLLPTTSVALIKVLHI